MSNFNPRVVGSELIFNPKIVPKCTNSSLFNPKLQSKIEVVDVLSPSMEVDEKRSAIQRQDNIQHIDHEDDANVIDMSQVDDGYVFLHGKYTLQEMVAILYDMTHDDEEVNHIKKKL